MVTCKICGIKRKRLGYHIKTHGLDALSYRELFPHAEIDCKETIQKVSNF